MKRYTEYKDSGVPWIGEIPGHWTLARNKAFLFERKETVGKRTEFPLLSLTREGVIYRDIESGKGKFPKDFDTYKIVSVGDAIFCLFDVDETPRTVGLSEKVGMITGAYNVFAIHDIDKRFLYYFYIAIDDKKGMRPLYTGLRKVINVNKFLSAKLAVPTPAEQEKIVAFLDKQTNLIESCICLRERELQTLNELKQAKIASAVTRGLNPNVPMKDSGIPWIGMIPAHWEITQLRKYLRLVSEKNHPDETLLSVTREQGVIIRNTESKEENHNYIPDDLSGYKLVKEGQFVINKMKSWQGSYAVSKYNGIVSPAYYVCDLNFPDKEFFSIAIRSQAYIGFFTQLSKGIRVGQWDLSTIALKSVPFFEPPIEEQHQIVEYIKQSIASVESYIASLEKEIEYLKEYKQRLISDVVTGKVDVRDEA